MERGSSPEDIYRELFKSGFSKGELRKVRIVDATVKSIATKGIDHTTFDSVAKLAKMAPAHVAYYFPTREEMVKAAITLVVMTAQRITVELIQKAGDPLSRLKAMIDGAFDHVERYPDHVSVLIYFYHVCSYDRESARFHAEFREMGARRLEKILGEMQASASAGPRSGELMLLGRRIQELFMGAVFSWAALGRPVELPTLRGEIWKAVLSLLRADALLPELKKGRKR